MAADGWPLIVLAESPLVAALETVPLLTDVLIGLGFGTIAGKLTVHGIERHGRELSPLHVRRIESAWIAFAVTFALTINAVLELP